METLHKMKNQTNYQTLGEMLRQLREENNLMQREVGAVIEVDGALISKVENNEKPINREHLKKLSAFFQIDEEILQLLWLADKIRNIIKDEPLGLKALNYTHTKLNNEH